MHGTRGTDVGQLSQEAENERLKTTVLVLNQKLNDQNDFEDQIQQLKVKNKQLEDELRQKREKYSDFESIIASLKTEREELIKENDDLVQEIGDIKEHNNQLETKSQKFECEN